MALRNVTSNDDRKPAAVAALKAASGKRSVTMLHHDTERDTFVGHCFNRGKGSQDERTYFWAVRVDTGELVGYYDGLAEYKAAKPQAHMYPAPKADTPQPCYDCGTREGVSYRDGQCTYLCDDCHERRLQGRPLKRTEERRADGEDGAVCVASNTEVELECAPGSCDCAELKAKAEHELHVRSQARRLADQAREHDDRRAQEVYTTQAMADAVSLELARMGMEVATAPNDARTGWCVEARWTNEDDADLELVARADDEGTEADARRKVVAEGQAHTLASKAAMSSTRNCRARYLTEAHAQAVGAELTRLGMHVSVARNSDTKGGTMAWCVDAIWPRPKAIDVCDAHDPRNPGCSRCPRPTEEGCFQPKATHCSVDAEDLVFSGLVTSDARRAELAELLRLPATSRHPSAEECGEAARALSEPTERELSLEGQVDDLVKLAGEFLLSLEEHTVNDEVATRANTTRRALLAQLTPNAEG